jgi:glycosyltransferase involved in cell wall biosynthesis
MNKKSTTVAIFGQLLHGSAGGIETNLLKLLAGLSAINGPDDRQLVIGPGGESSWFNPYLGCGQDIVSWPPLRYEMPSITRAGFAAGIYRMFKKTARSLLRRGISTDLSNSAAQLTLELKSMGVEVVHFPYQRYFPTTLPFIFEPWDLQHIYLPDLLSQHEIDFRNWLYKQACEEAAIVVTATHSTKKDLIQHFEISSSKIAVIPRGANNTRSDKFSKSDAELTRVKYNLPERFAFYPAKTWAHKNHIRLFQALAHLKKTQGLEIPIVCTGKPIQASQEAIQKSLQELALDGQVIFTGFLDDVAIQHLYTLTELMIFPSLFEGLGIPILEAMEFGTPVVCSQASCLPEIGGDAAIFFDPYSIEDMAEKIAMVWSNSDLQNELQKRGQARAPLFSWEEAALSFKVLYRYVANKNIDADQKKRLNMALSGIQNF